MEYVGPIAIVLNGLAAVAAPGIPHIGHRAGQVARQSRMYTHENTPDLHRHLASPRAGQVVTCVLSVEMSSRAALMPKVRRSTFVTKRPKIRLFRLCAPKKRPITKKTGLSSEAMRRSTPASEIFPLELVSENFPEDVDMRLTTNSLTSSFYVAVCQLVSATPALHAASSLVHLLAAAPSD